MKHKAWLCVRGDLQPPTAQDTYAATLAARTFRALIAIAAVFDLEIWHLDAVNAFTNSSLDETIHCTYQLGFEIEGQCLHLLRALYSLRRSPLLWLRELSQTLVSLGFKEALEGSCLFTDGCLIVLFYVDDLLLLGQKENITELCRL